MESNEIIKGNITPMPWKKLSGPYVLLLCEAISTTSFFTYVSAFVLFLNVTNDKEKIGYYAGFVASVFSLSQFASSFFWGKMSDKYGRKPILLIGSFGSIISTICIGTSYTLPILIGSRAINGLLNGNIGVVKTYIGECTDKSNQVEAFGLIGLTWGVGTILGSSVGGVLTNPVESMPSIFGSSTFFKHFPFLLTNLVLATTTAIGCLFTFFFMKETLHVNESKSISLLNLKTTKSGMIVNGEDEDEEDENELILNSRSLNLSIGRNEDEDGANVISSIQLNHDSKSIINETNSFEYPIQQTNETNSILTVGSIIIDEADTAATTSLLIQQPRNEDLDYEQSKIITTHEINENFEDINLSSNNNDNFLKRSYSKFKLKLFKNSNGGKNNSMYQQLEKTEKTEKTSGNNLFKDKLIMKTTFLYAFVGLMYTMLDEVFPIWAFNKSSSGGLDMTTSQIGICGVVGGISVILVQVFAIKPVSRKFGLIKTFTIGSIFAVFSFISFPILNVTTPLKGMDSSFLQLLFWFLVTLVLTFRNVAAQFIFTPVMTLINNSAKVTVRGSANGLGQSLVALTRAVAPPLAGSLLSWSLTNNQPFPLNHYFVFLLMAIFSVFAAIVGGFFLPISLNAPIEEADIDQDDINSIPIHCE